MMDSVTNLELCKRFLSGDKSVINNFPSYERLQACVRYWVCKGDIRVEPNLLAVYKFEQKLMLNRQVLVKTDGLYIRNRTFDWKIIEN